ncbi:hypothetical protein PMIN03_004214 [Paraphaeosphaeria minitans]
MFPNGPRPFPNGHRPIIPLLYIVSAPHAYGFLRPPFPPSPMCRLFSLGVRASKNEREEERKKIVRYHLPAAPISQFHYSGVGSDVFLLVGWSARELSDT